MKHYRDRQLYAQIEALLQRTAPAEFVDFGAAEVAAPEEAAEVAETGEAEPAAAE
jgi:hypothetical protein